MKKIFLSLALIGLLGSGAIAATRAYFSDVAEVKGITISSGNADLKFETEAVDGVDANGHNKYIGLDSIDFDNSLLAAFKNLTKNLYPGFYASGALWLQNRSSGDFDLSVNGRLVSASDWPNLADVVSIRVTAKSGYGTGSTGWKTLTEWNAVDGIQFPGRNIPNYVLYGDHQGYDVEIKVDSNAGNEIANLTLDDVVFELLATQVAN